MARYEQVLHGTVRQGRRSGRPSDPSHQPLESSSVLAAWFLASGSLATCIGKQALAPCVAADALMPQGAKRVMRTCNQRAASSVVRTSVQSSAAAKRLGLRLVSFWAQMSERVSRPTLPSASQQSPRRGEAGSFAAVLVLALGPRGPRMESLRLQRAAAEQETAARRVWNLPQQEIHG